MRNFISFTSFILLASLSSFASAVDYYFYPNGDGNTRFSSASAACAYIQTTTWSSWDITSFKVNHDGGDYYVCSYSTTSNRTITSVVRRAGNECPSGGKFDESSGICEVKNKCQELKDTPIPAFKWSSPTDMPPSAISVNGCAATVTKARCSYVTSGKASCTGTATLTGEEMPADPKGTADSCEGSDCTSGLPEPTKENKECVYVSNSSGSASCTAISSENNPGNSDCGTVNGEFKCIRNPKATSVENKLESTKTEKSNTDGTLSIVKDNTLTTTKCVDKTCTTSTTSSKGTTTTDSNGNKVGESSTCSGANCNGKGETNGTGDDNKSGDDGKDDEGEEEEGSDTPPVTPISPPEKGNLDGEADAWDTKIADSKTELKDALGKIKDSFSPVGELSLGGGGGGLYCPPPVQVMGASFDICLDKYQDKLSWIGSAIFAVFAVIAVLIIFN